jgi:regulator of sirC expression with transglutaminase-like and TPR domain
VNWFADDVEFQKLRRGRRDVDLVSLLIEYARDEYPELDAGAIFTELDRLGEAARNAVNELPSTADTADRLRAISRVLYEVEGFSGNDDDYYDPRNSYVNDVVTRRRGIPISLAIVYAAVAERAGVKMFGVGAPGHFVLTSADFEVVGRRASWFVDPFTDGRVLTLDECIELVEQRSGGQFRISGEHLRPASPWEIGLRVLRNLKACHAMRNDWRAALPVQRRLLELLPNLEVERRDLGLIYLKNGEPRRALEYLEPYLLTCPAEERLELESFLKAARRLAAELN